MMAKKKSRSKPPAPVSDERVAVIVLKGSPEYRDWLGLMSKQTLIPVASIVRDALAKWAKERNFPGPPER